MSSQTITENNILPLPQSYQAIRFYAPGDIRLEEVTMPALEPGEVIIKIEAASTNGTDLKAFLRGHPILLKQLPSFFGHEAVGVVVTKCDTVKQFNIGDRVVPANSAPCGSCNSCQSEKYTLCENLELLNGTYAQYLKIPANIVEKNLYRVPQDIPYQKLLPVESLAVCIRGIEQLALQKNDEVLILGCGPIATLLAKVAKLNGANVTLMGRKQKAVELAQQYSQADSTMLWIEPNILNKQFPIVIEATGNVDVWEQAIHWVQPGGKVLYFGGCPSGSIFSLPTGLIHYKEITILGAFHHTPKHFKQAVDWVIENKLDLSPFVSAQLPLTKLNEAFELMKNGQVQKAAITP